LCNHYNKNTIIKKCNHYNEKGVIDGVIHLD